MSDSRGSTGGLVGLLGAAMAVCCALPVLLGAGIAVGAAGLALGSGVVVAAGIALGFWGWRRRRSARQCQPTPPKQEQASHPHSRS